MQAHETRISSGLVAAFARAGVSSRLGAISSAFLSPAVAGPFGNYKRRPGIPSPRPPPAPPPRRRDRPESFLFLGETLRHAGVRAGTSLRDYFLCKGELYPADGPSRLQRAPFRVAQSLSDPPCPRNSCFIHCNRAISLSHREIAKCLRARRKSRGRGELIGKIGD